MFALWHKHPLPRPLPAVCRHLWQKQQVSKTQLHEGEQLIQLFL